MLVWIVDYLLRYAGEFRVFEYLTVRTIMSTFTAFAIVVLGGPSIIRWFNAHSIDKTVREDGPRSHLRKTGTPTMGGAFFVPAILLSTLLWSDLTNFYVWVLVATTFLFSLIGFVDDGLNLYGGHAAGLSVRTKLLWQIIFATAVSCVLFYFAPTSEMTKLMLPIFKGIQPDLGYWFIFMSVLVVIGTSNAVNLTDGLDGLAVMPVVLVGAALGLIAYLVGHAEFARYLYIPHIDGSGELAVFCAALCGAGLGFLWFNSYPAQVFMGDTGSLSLGAALGMMAVITRHELVLFIMGGVFVAEALSVIVQVSFYKLTGSRVFKMAPIHHHFELLGWPEPKVIVRFWIITVLLVLLGLATLKLR